MEHPQREIMWSQRYKQGKIQYDRGEENEICYDGDSNYDDINKDRRHRQSSQGPIPLFSLTMTSLLLLVVLVTTTTVEGMTENAHYTPNFPIKEFNNYLAIATGSNDANDLTTPVISATACDFGADIRILATQSIPDNVKLDLATLFMHTSDATIVGAQAKWVDDTPDYLPGAGMIHEGLTWTGDLALTSSQARYYCEDTELYAQKGISSTGRTQPSGIQFCHFFSDGNGDGFDTTGDFVNFTQPNVDTPMTQLRTDLRSLYSYISEMEPDATLKTNAGLDDKDLPTPANIQENSGIYETNIDKFDINNDQLAVIDIDCNNPENEFVIENLNWIIESESLSTFAIFRLLGDCTMKVEKASILTGDGIVMNYEGGKNYNPNIDCLFLPYMGFSAIFVKLKSYVGTGGLPNENTGGSMESTDTIFELSNTVISGIGFYDLTYYAEKMNGGLNDGGKTKMKVTNTQGCGQFVSPFIAFENVRLQTCGFATLNEVDTTTTATRTIESVYSRSNSAYNGKSNHCDRGVKKKTFSCNSQLFPHFGLVTEGDADVSADTVDNGMAIGGQLNGLSSDSGFTTHVNRGKVYANKIEEPDRFIFMEGHATGLKLDATEGAAIDFDFFKYLAFHALPITIERSVYKVFVEKLGGTYSMDDFGTGSGKDTLVIFNTSETVTLTKTQSGAPFGPSVIAPFAEVQVEGSAGSIDGFVIAKNFTTKGNTSATHLKMHGNPYEGPIDCTNILNHNYMGDAGKSPGQKTVIEMQLEEKKEREKAGAISKNAQMNNCKTQKECVFFDVMEKPDKFCSNQYGCEFEVCLTLDFTKEGCPKPSMESNTADYTCIKSPTTCMDSSLFSFGGGQSTKISSLANGYRQCQTAGPNTKVEFLLRDGNCGSGRSGKATMGVTGSSIANKASCEPRGFSTATEKITSCDYMSTSEQECVWSVVTPQRCQLYSNNGIEYTDQHGCSVTFVIKDIGNDAQNVVTVRTCPNCEDCE